MRNTRLSGRRRPAVVALSGAVLLATAGVAYAVGTVNTNTINGCYKTAAPNTLSIRSGATCPAGTTALSWNKQGPQGKQGIQGVQGIQGIQGPPGMSGFQTVTAATGVIPAGNIGAIDVPCPSGETAISGGYAVPYTATVLETHPRSDNAGTWNTVAAFPSVSGTITVYVQCAQVAGVAARSSRHSTPARPTVKITPLVR